MAAAPFVVVWKKALRDTAMPIGRKSFGAWLETWADRNGTNCWPSIATLVRLGYSKATVYRHLAALEADGWLRVKHGGGRRPDGTYEHNVYALCLPSEPNGVSTETVRRGVTVPLLRRSGTSPENLTVSVEVHDHSHLPLPTTTTPTPTPQKEENVLSTKRSTPTTPRSNGSSSETVPSGREKDDISNPTPAAKAAQTALRERATAAGLDLLDLRDIIFATTGKTRAEMLEPGEETRKVARAIDAAVGETYL